MSENITLADKVRTFIAKQFGTDVKELTNETSFVKDLKADSLESVEMIMDLEEEFGIVIPDEDAEKITTVGEAVRYIEEKMTSLTTR